MTRHTPRHALLLAHAPEDAAQAETVRRLSSLGRVTPISDLAGASSVLVLWSRFARHDPTVGAVLEAAPCLPPGRVVTISLDGTPLPDVLRAHLQPRRVRRLRALAGDPGPDLSTHTVVPGLAGRIRSLDRVGNLGFYTALATFPVVALLISGLDPLAVFLTTGVKLRVIAMLCVMMVMVAGLWGYLFARLDLRALGRRLVAMVCDPLPPEAQDEIELIGEKDPNDPTGGL